MKLLRLKITDSRGFRGLPAGFEHRFRSGPVLQDDTDRQDDGFAPFVCAGRNGSGKSNLLEALAAIFYQLEVQRARRSFLPAVFEYDPTENPQGIKESEGRPNAYELEYLIQVPDDYVKAGGRRYAHIQVLKESDKPPALAWINDQEFNTSEFSTLTDDERSFLLPEYVLGYSSGENETLSLPFFKLRFVQFDEYWNDLVQQNRYKGRPETRLVYLDSSFSQAILLCNLLFQEESRLAAFRQDIGIDALMEFRILIRRSIPIDEARAQAFMAPAGTDDRSSSAAAPPNPALFEDEDEFGTPRYRVNIMRLLEGDAKSSLMVSALKRCATLIFVDEDSDTLILDYRVDAATKTSFQENFGGSPLVLFQALQVLLTLNLYAVDEGLKTDLYRSDSDYVNETVPVLASDARIMRFKNFYFSKQGVDKPMLLKELSDGEHQLLHSLGLCLLFGGTKSVYLLDEPETHFNPDWRANFISRLRDCMMGESKHIGKDVSESDSGHDMLITTHTPYLISDSRPEHVLVFGKDEHTGELAVSHPKYNTLGASINKITMETFDKRETIGERAREVLAEFAALKELPDTNLQVLAADIQQAIGDSVERTLLIKAILDAAKTAQGAR